MSRSIQQSRKHLYPEIAALYRSGLGIDRIAARFDVSATTVMQALKKEGVETRKQRVIDPRTCCECKEAKPLTDFYAEKHRAGGKGYMCKLCCKLHHVKQQPFKASKLYGISPDEYVALYKSQGEVCAICAQKNPSGKMLSLDHDHQTGKIRGLLCDRCNRGIGLLRDDPQLLKLAIDYLLSHSTAPSSA